MNTAEKLEYQEQMNLMVQLSGDAFARAVWDNPKKAIEIHKFWQEFSHDKSDEIKAFAKLEMTRIEATLVQMTNINVGFYGSKPIEYLDRIGMKPENNDDTSIEDVLPETEVVVDSETNLTEQEEESVKTVSLFNGEDMGDKPNQTDVSAAAKKLLAEGREEDAIALAKQYLGTENYTPKKPGGKTHEWKDKEIMSWIKSIKVSLSKSTPKAEEPKVEDQSAATADDAETFGTTRATLEAERAAFKDFAERYVRLATNGSEDAAAAEDLSKLFFENREYNDAQIQVWKETVTKNDESSVLDHFAVLGAIGTDDNQLIISDTTYEDINTRVYDMMQEIQVAKSELDDLQSHMVEEIGRKLYDELINTCFTSESGATYEMYTKLHYTDFIERVVAANFTELDSPATTSEEGGQETGEASSSKTKESDIEDVQATAMETIKKKTSTGNTVKEITLAIIKNGGVVKDTIDNPRYKGFYGKEHKFTRQDSLEKHIADNFEAWKEEYLNSQTQYPSKDFKRMVETAYHSDVPFKDFVEEAKEIMVRPDGELLALFDKKSEVETRFPSVEDLEKYISKIYKTNKNAESDKAAQAEVQKNEPESGAESEAEETTTDESSGEATKPTVESSSDVVVKVTHIQNICNKAAKKKGDLSFIMKDRKISELVEKGGTITGPEKDASVSYDLSAESTDQLHADLKKLFDEAVEKRSTKTDKKTIIDKVKQITSPSKDENSEEAKTEETTQELEPTETESSTISSLNDIKPAGLKLIEEGGSKEDLLQWGRDNLLNRQMKEQPEDKDVFKTAEAVDKFMKGMFSDFLKEETPETTEDVKTVDDLKNFIIAASKEEGATYIKVCKAAKDHLNENSWVTELKEGKISMFELVRENAVELYKAHLEKQKNTREESEEKVFVPEKISETVPTVWDKVKDFKTLGEIYAISLELCDQGDWQQALNIATELIKSGKIETAEEWTDDMITDWFDKNVLKKEVAESTEEATVVEEVEDLDKNFKDLQRANGGKSFRNVLIQILSENEDTPELRKKIVDTVRGCKANYGKRMAKAKEDVIQGKINAAKLLVKKA